MGLANKMTDFKKQDKDCAVHVLQEEAAALQALAGSINDQFHAAIDAVHTMKNTQKGAGRLIVAGIGNCLLYTSPSPRDLSTSRMPSSA